MLTQIDQGAIVAVIDDSWIYNCLCNQCLSPLMLWVRISIRARCTTLCDKVCEWLKTVIISGYSCFLHQWNWPPRYNWSIVESGIKHHKTNQPSQPFF